MCPLCSLELDSQAAEGGGTAEAEYDVVIVGAGVAGLSCAVALREQTASVVPFVALESLPTATMPTGAKDPSKVVAIKIVEEETAKFVRAEYGGNKAAFIADARAKRLGPNSKYGRRVKAKVKKDGAYQRAFKEYWKLGNRVRGAQLYDKIEAEMKKKKWWEIVTKVGRDGGKKISADARTAIAVGEVSYTALQRNSGRAEVTALEGKGVHAAFADPEAGIDALLAVSAVATGEEAEPIPNMFRSFEDGVVKEIATETVLHRLGLLAGKTGETVEAILGDHELSELVEMTVSAIFKMVEEELGIAAADDHEVLLRAESLVAIKTDYDNIVTALEDGIAAAIPCKADAGNGPYCIAMGFKEMIDKQYCVGGGTVRQGLKPGNYKRKWYTSPGVYVIDAFGPQGWIFDLDSNHNARSQGLHLKVRIPGTPNYVRILDVNLHSSSAHVTSAHVTMRDNKGKDCTRKLHQILQVNLASWGLGMRNNKEYQRYLRSRKRGASSAEDAFPYSGQDYGKYLRKLKAKGWTQVEFAKWCDVDHCVGRSEVWMHNALFTRFCSHRWNTCMSYVRLEAGDWCFGLGAKAYGNGND